MEQMADKKPRTKKEMLEYLQEHFRYHTMNSWNLSTTYAHNVKFSRLELTSEEINKAYDLLECNEVWEDINIIIDDFGTLHDWKWQMAFNGRSGGYIVLLQGGSKPSVYTQPGLSFDDDVELPELSNDELKWRIDIVWDFDKTVEKIFELFRDYCRNAEVKEETIMVPKKIKTAVFAEKEV